MVVKVMLYTDRNQLAGIDDEVIRRFWNKQIAVLTFETIDTATPASETAALNETNSAHLDGTTTPVQLLLTSTDAEDLTSSGVGLTGVLAMGIKATDSSTAVGAVPATVTCVMLGQNTAATADGTYWVRFYGFRQAATGTGGAAAGDVTFSDPTDTTIGTYAKITASYPCSSVGRIYIPAGWAACCFRADVAQNQSVTTTSHAVYSVRYYYFKDEYASPDGNALTITRDKFGFGGLSGNNETIRLRQIPLKADTTGANSYINFYGDLVDGTLTGSVKFYVLMVKIG